MKFKGIKGKLNQRKRALTVTQRVPSKGYFFPFMRLLTSASNSLARSKSCTAVSIETVVLEEAKRSELCPIAISYFVNRIEPGYMLPGGIVEIGSKNGRCSCRTCEFLSSSPI